MNAKPTALDTYLAHTATIHAGLARLQQLTDEHFGHDPNAINWGHVGDLGRVEAGLDELLAIFTGVSKMRLSQHKFAGFCGEVSGLARAGA